MQGIGLNTYQVGLGQSVEAEVRRINRRGLAIKVRASDFTQPLGRMSAKANEFTKSLEASNARVIAFGASAAIIGGVTTTFAQLVIQATKVEKILADINAVLGTSAANLQRFGDGLFKVARNTSQSLEVAAEAALEFSRQGLNMEETLRRTNDALILTRLTGLKAADAVKGLTAAVNGFADVGLTTTQIINKLAAVDVKFAVSADDLVNALARAGAVAQDAGVNFDQLVGAVTAAQQITARGGSVIGNSFKTIFTRIQRSSTVDRLQELGIAVKDLKGQTLPALTVLKNLSDSYDKLAFSTKAAVAEQVGGVFQINILKAALKDLSRESSIYSQATLTAANATNEAQVKNAMLQKTLASIANQTLTSVRELTANLGDLTLAPALKEFLEAANKIVGFMSDALGSKEGESLGGDFAKGFARAIGSVIAGPGMFVLIMVFTKLFSQAFKFARNSVKDLLQIQSIKEKERAIQESIVDAMIRNEALSESLMKHTNNKSKQEEIVLKLLQKQTREIEQQRSIAKSIAPKLRAAGVQPNLVVESAKSKSSSKADGLIPSSPATPMEARRERAGAAKAGYASGPVSTMSIPDLGRVVYNKNETVKRFRGMKQPAIMPPESSVAGKTYGNQFQKQHGFNPYQSSGYIPNFTRSRLFDNWTDFSPTSSRQRGSRSSGKMRELDMAFFYPAAGSGPSASLKVYKDIVRSAEAGNPYTHIDGGSIIGPRIPKMLVTGNRMLEKARASGKKIPRMQMLGELYPSMLTSKINKFASEYKDGFRPSPIDYKPGEEAEVEKYLRAMGLDPKDTRGTKLSKIFPRGFGSGLIPNFALEAMRVGSSNILRLPTSKMITETTMSDFKGNKHTGWKTLEAPLSNIQKFATSYADEFSALRGMGIDVLQRKMYFANQSSLMDKKVSRSVANTQRKARGAKKGSHAYRNQHKIAGSAYESALDKNALGSKNYKNTWEGEYGLKGITSGAGDQNAKVDFIKEGGLPIEAKYGKYTQANLLAKSVRLFSDRYVEDFLLKNDQHGLAQKMHDRKYYESQKLLQSLGHERPDADMIKRFGLSGGFVPNFLKLYQPWVGSGTAGGGYRGNREGLNWYFSDTRGAEKSLEDFSKVRNRLGKGKDHHLSDSFLKEYHISQKNMSNMLTGNYDARQILKLRKLLPDTFTRGVGHKKLKGSHPTRPLAKKSSNMFGAGYHLPYVMLDTPSQSTLNQVKNVFSPNLAQHRNERLVTDEYLNNRDFIEDLSVAAEKPERAINAARREGMHGLKEHVSKKPSKFSGLIPNFESANQKDIAKTIEDIDKRDKSSGFIPNLSIGPTRRPIQAIGNSNLKPPQFWKKVLKFTKDNLKKGLHLEAGNFDNYSEALSEYGYLDLPSRIMSPSQLDSAVNEKSHPETRKTVQHISRLLKNNRITANRANKRSMFGNQVEQALGINFNASPTGHQYPMDFIENSPLKKAISGGVRKSSLFLNHQVGDAVVSPSGHKPVKFFSKFLAHGILSNQLKFDKEGFIKKTNWNSASFNTFGGAFADLIAHGGVGQKKDTPEKVIALGEDIINENNRALAGKVKPEKTYQLTYKKDFWNYTPLGMKSPTYDGNFNGLIPNFANPLGEAIAREKNALSSQGSNAKVYVDQDNRLKNFKNPMGLLVANTRDEPSSGSQGVNRAINMGLDPKTHGASDGFISSFMKLKPAPDHVRARHGLPSRGNEMSKSQDAVIKKNKEISQTGNDMMLRLMGLTTVMYAFEGALNAGAEGASEFQRVLGTLSSIVMGLSQGAMVLDATRNLGKGAGNTMGKGASRMKNSIAIGKRKAAMSGSKLSGLKVGAGAAAKGTGTLIKGAGGAIAGMLGPLGMAIAVIIPIFSALKDNFGWFTGATEQLAKELEKAQNKLSSLAEASDTAKAAQETSIKLEELKSLGVNRSIKQEEEFVKLQIASIKQETKLADSVDEVTRNFNLSDSQLAELNGSYRQQIDMLGKLQIEQARLAAIMARTKGRSEDFEEDYGEDIFDIFKFQAVGNKLSKLNDLAKLEGRDRGQVATDLFDIDKVRSMNSGDRANMLKELQSASQFALDNTFDNLESRYDSSEATQITGQMDYEYGVRGKSADNSGGQNSLAKLEDFTEKYSGLFKNEMGSEQLGNLLANSIETAKMRDLVTTGSARMDEKKAMGRRSVEGMINELTKNLNISESTGGKKPLYDARATNRAANMASKIQFDTFKTVNDLALKRLDIESRIYAMAQKRAGLDDEIEDFLGVLTDEEKVQRSTQRKLLAEDRNTTQKNTEGNIEAKVKSADVFKDNITKDIINKQILDETVGLRLDKIREVLLSQDIKEEINKLTKAVEDEETALTKQFNEDKANLDKKYQDKIQKGYFEGDSEAIKNLSKHQKVFLDALSFSKAGTEDFNVGHFNEALAKLAKASGVNLKEIKDAMNIEVDLDDNELDFTFDLKGFNDGITANNDFSIDGSADMLTGHRVFQNHASTGKMSGSDEQAENDLNNLVLRQKNDIAYTQSKKGGTQLEIDYNDKMSGIKDRKGRLVGSAFAKKIEEARKKKDEELVEYLEKERLAYLNSQGMNPIIKKVLGPVDKNGNSIPIKPTPRTPSHMTDLDMDEAGAKSMALFNQYQERKSGKTTAKYSDLTDDTLTKQARTERTSKYLALLKSQGAPPTKKLTTPTTPSSPPAPASQMDFSAGAHTMESVLKEASSVSGSKEIQSSVKDLTDKLISNLEALMLDRKEQGMSVEGMDVANAMRKILNSSGLDFSTQAAFLDQVNAQSQNPENASLSTLTGPQLDNIKLNLAKIEADRRNNINFNNQTSDLNSADIGLDALMESFKNRTSVGFTEVKRVLGRIDSQPEGLEAKIKKAEDQRLKNRTNFGGIEARVAEGQLSSVEEQERDGRLWLAVKEEKKKELAIEQRNNIENLAKLQANNDLLELTDRGTKMAQKSLQLETEGMRARKIEIQNKLKSANLEEELAKQAEIQVKTKLGQLDLDYKTLAAKQKYYENTNALAEEVAKELKARAQQDDMQRSRTREEYFQQDTLDQERGNGRTYRQNRIANQFGDSIDARGEQIKDARTSMEYQFGKGNSLKGSEARLQMLQLQKEQNIEQGKTGLFADTIAVRIAETNVELERFNETLANTTFDAVKDGFKGMVNAMADGTKSMGDAFLGFLGGIASAIHEQLLDRATKQITSGIFEMMGMDSISQNNSGGLIKGFSQGGSTGGARQTPAMLTSGEYVVRKKIVDRLGVSALDKINKGGSVDGSLESLYQQSNENSFDMSTSGSATLPSMVRFNESGHLNNLISKISSPIVQLNSGGVANPFAARESDSAAMKISKGAGYLAGSMAANYSDRDKSSNSGPEKPRHPNETRLNTMSALNIDPTGRQMTARYRKNDDYSKQYGDYLLAKYQHDVDQRNQKVDERASMAKGIMGSITGSLVSAGVAKGVQALSNFNKVVGFNPMGWNKEDMGNRAQSYIDRKGITGKNFQSKDSSLYNFSREGHNALARMDMYGTKREFGGVSGHRNVEYNKEGWGQLNQKGYVQKAFDKDFRSDPNAMSTKIANSNKKSFEDIKHTWNANNPIKPTDMTPHMTFSYERKSAGGRVEGPGGIDQVGPVMLDKGEYVVRASSVNNIEKKYPGFFDRLNSMRMNEGGPVTAAPPATTAEAETSTTQNSSSNVTVNINISSGGQASVEGGGGGDQAFASKIKDAVVGVIAQEKRVGGMLSG